MIDYPFTEKEMQAASDTWGANCGPSALAFALQIGIEEVRGTIPGFEERRYTSPTMMKAALANLGKTFDVFPADVANMFRKTHTQGINLTRIQWTGPWTDPGANPKWAYRQSHWICSYLVRDRSIVFDCNGGIMGFDEWKEKIVPLLTAMYPRADGGFFPTHVWRIQP